MPDETLSMCTGTGCVPGAHGELVHTPTPWCAWQPYARDEINPSYLWHIGPDDGRRKEIITVWSYHSNHTSNVALIVRAVNAHADLVAALRDIRDLAKRMAALHPSRDLREVLPDPGGLAVRIDAALAKANTP